MDRHVGVSELRRRPMQIIREARDSTDGTTITYRGAPVAVLRGLIALPESAPDPETRAGWRDAGSDRGEPGEAPDFGDGGWAGNPGAQAPETDAVLDSVSWGLWEGLSDEQRRALLRAIRAQSRGTDGELA